MIRFNMVYRLISFASFFIALSLQAGQGTLDDPYVASECTDVSACPSGVYLFSPEQGLDAIQAATDIIYLKISGGDPNLIAQYKPVAEWSEDRYALMFLPGDYSDVTVKLNYYTQVLGLGEQSNQVTLNNLFTDNLCILEDDTQTCLSTGALNNFWRGVENVAFQPTGCVIPGDPTDDSIVGDNPCVIYNVSQAAPMRNVDVLTGDLILGLAGCFDLQGPCLPADAEVAALGDTLRQCTGEFDENFSCGAGFASGGYLADSDVSGSIISLSQQQWFTRDSSFEQWIGGVWNLFFLNTEGELPANPNEEFDTSSERFGGWQSFPVTEVTVDENLISNNSKPYLISSSGSDNTFSVVVPGVQDETIPLSDFVVMNAENQDIGAINTELATKRGLLIEPGIFELDQPLTIANNQVVLGVGLPELICSSGNSCLRVSGQGAKVAGMLIGAGFEKSQSLVQVDGTLGNATSSDQASILYDIFCRIGERNPTRGGANQVGPTTGNCVQIDANFTMGDNLWLWRGDHDRASYAPDRPQRRNLVEFTQNPSDNGLVVNGDDVTMFALFSEHHNNSNVVWNGDRGKTYFYQSEIAYKLPNDFQCAEAGIVGGCPSYYIAEGASDHEAFGLGAYTFFQQNTLIRSAVQAPAGSSFTNVFARYLNDEGEILSDSGIESIITDYQGGVLGGGVTLGEEDDRTAALGVIQIGEGEASSAEIPSTEAEAPSTEAEAPSTEAEAPSTEAETPSAEAEAPSTEAEAPSTEAETPSAEAEAPSTEAETPSTEAEAPSTEAETPSTEVETPSTEVETPSTEAETQSTEAEAPSTEAETPSTEAETPSTEAEAPSTEAEAPSAEGDSSSAANNEN